MGFRSVYRSLTELFPQIDPKILRGIAIEHQHDADEAASAVISEICPLSSPNFKNKNKNKVSENPRNVKVEECDLQTNDGSLSLSQWLQPSKLPHSYLALLNEEPIPDVKPPPPDVFKRPEGQSRLCQRRCQPSLLSTNTPPLDYVVEKVVLPSRGAGGGIRTMYSSDNIGGSSLVKPSIRVQSSTNNDFSGSSSKVPPRRQSSRKSAQQWSPDYSEKLRSWKTRSNNNNNNNTDFSQLCGKDRDVPSKQSNRNNYTTERERKQRIDNNIKALGELLPNKVEEDNPESTLNAIIAHVKLLHLQMKELARSRLGGEPSSHPMTLIEGHGHYIHHEKTMTKSLEEAMEELVTNDFDAAANLLESKGLYLMPLSSGQGFCS